MIKMVTGILPLFRSVFVRLGVNFEQLLAIVTAKLTVDNRIDKSGRTNKDVSNALMKQGIIYGITGPLFFLAGSLKGDLPVTLLFFHSFLMLMLIMSFLMEYSQLLFNQNDNHILQHLPVNSKTILAARIVSMLVYMLFLVGCMSIIPLVIVIFWKGVIAGGWFIVSVFLNTIFTLLLANVIYLGGMRFVPTEKFQRVMSYAQIVLIAGVTLSYQVVGRLVMYIQMDMMHPELWMYFTPPCYFLSLTSMVKEPTAGTFLLAGIGLVVTVLLLIFTIRYLAPYFSVKVSTIGEYTPVRVRRVRGRVRFAYALARIFARNSLQTTGFMLAWRMTRDNLKYRQGVLPMMIYAVVLAVFFVFSQDRVAAGNFGQFFPLYLMVMINVGILSNMSIMEKGDLLWLYRSKPLARPGAIILGGFKALYVKYFLPVFILLGAVFTGVFGWEMLGDIYLILAMTSLISLFYLRISGLLFPFSKEKGTVDSGGNVMKMIVLMLLLVVVGVIHAAVRGIPWGLVGVGTLSRIGVWILSRMICRVSWQRIAANY